MEKRVIQLLLTLILLFSISTVKMIETNEIFYLTDNFDDNIISSEWDKINAQATGYTIWIDESNQENIVEQDKKIEIVADNSASGKGYFSLGKQINRTSLTELSLDFYYNFSPLGYIQLSGFDSKDNSMAWRMFIYDSWVSSNAAYQFIALDPELDAIYNFDSEANGFPDQEGVFNFKGLFKGNNTMDITLDGEIYHTASISGEIHYWDYIMITFGINHDNRNNDFYIKADDYSEKHDGVFKENPLTSVNSIEPTTTVSGQDQIIDPIVLIGGVVVALIGIFAYYRNNKLNKEGMRKYGKYAEEDLFPAYKPNTIYEDTPAKSHQNQFYENVNTGYSIPEVSIDGIGNVRVCCNQTARLKEQYCQCGMVISQKLLDYYHPE